MILFWFYIYVTFFILFIYFFCIFSFLFQSINYTFTSLSISRCIFYDISRNSAAFCAIQWMSFKHHFSSMELKLLTLFWFQRSQPYTIKISEIIIIYSLMFFKCRISFARCLLSSIWLSFFISLYIYLFISLFLYLRDRELTI